jgi:hypothetical protein
MTRVAHRHGHDAQPGRTQAGESTRARGGRVVALTGGMNSFLRRSLLPALVAIGLTSTAAVADGPYSYTGHGGIGDMIWIAYHDLLPGQTQTVTFNLNTGNALQYPTHFAVSAHGAYDGTTGHGRGIALGHMEGIPGIQCTSGTAVAVEDFSNRGILVGTEICYPFADNVTYRIVVNVNDNDVWYSIFERVYDDYRRAMVWEEIISGGCYETMGRACPKDTGTRKDGNGGEVFIVSANGGPGSPSWNWSARSIYVTNN